MKKPVTERKITVKKTLSEKCANWLNHTHFEETYKGECNSIQFKLFT